MKGIGVSPGMAKGTLKHVRTKEDALNVQEGDIVYSEDLHPPLTSIARNANGFILIGNEADHCVSYLKELWKPCVVVNDITGLREGETVSIDGLHGTVHFGDSLLEKYSHHSPLQYSLKTKIYLQMSIPRMAKKAAALNTDGVGLARTNLIIEETGKHPYYYFVKKGKKKELVEVLTYAIKEIAEAFKPKPVWFRTMDFATDELVHMGAEERVEHNPLMGWRGLIRGLEQPELLEIEYQAIKNNIHLGNIGVIYPMVRDIAEYREAKKRMKSFGIVPHKQLRVGSMFETPSAALQIEEFILEGMDLAFIGINDITQYTLAADRANPNMQKVYNPANKAVLQLVYNIVEKCSKAKIETTTSFLSPLKDVLPLLLSKGLSSFTLQADRINEVAEIISKIEKS